MAKALRMYEIMYGAQDGRPIDDFEPPLNEEELAFYEETVKDVQKWRERGIEPIYELPVDAFDDEEGIEDIYPDGFDDNVIAEVEGAE